MNQDMERIKTELKNSLLFAMSLGFRELYHSNVWKWLLDDKEIGPRLLKKIFPDFKGTTFSVTREKGNRDITVWNEGESSAWVVENKFKSIPYAEQLQGYTADLGKRFAGGVLICIEQPEWCVEKWRVITYSDLMKDILEVLPDYHAKHSQIKEYVGVVRALLSVMKNFRKEHGDTWATKADCMDYVDVSVEDICLKLNAEALRLAIKTDPRYFGLAPNISGWSLEVITGYSRGESMIDVVYRRASNRARDRGEDMLRDMIGVELQGESYRKLIQFASVAENVYAKGCEIGWLEERTPQNRPRRGRARDSRFNQYNQGGGHFFVYQCESLQLADRKFVALKEKIFRDMKDAAKKVVMLGV